MNLTANHASHANRKNRPRRGCSRGSSISRFTASGQCPGNLAQDGRWDYTWDAENRLVKLAAGTGAGPQISLQFDYDHQGRRIRQRVWNNPTWSGNPTNDVRYVYDGWNLLASLNPASSVRQAYLWGLDMSGTMQGAGGVGGLLAITDASQGSHFCAYDGNGNVSALVKADDAGLTAQYEYGPFGELLRATGPMAKANPFRFSTKYQDDETDLIYYSYRYYDPSTGRWPNQDPIGEKGGRNLYNYVGNDPLDRTDPLGLVYGNPVSGPGGMWPSDPYSPGGAYYVPTPPGPTAGQQLCGGPDSPEVDQTAWFNLHYPGWSSYAQSYYKELIEKQIQKNCGKKYVANLPRLPVYPYYSDTFLSTRIAADMGDAGETRFGDQPQSRFSADKVLGSFVYKLDGLATVSYSDSLLLCCKRYTWKADVVVYDVLGFQPGDPGYYISFGLAPERGLIRARWTLAGSGVCCKK